jgi:hypothetical protein
MLHRKRGEIDNVSQCRYRLHFIELTEAHRKALDRSTQVDLPSVAAVLGSVV